MKILALLGAIQGIVLCLFFFKAEKNKAANRHMLAGILLSIIYMLLFVYVGNPFEKTAPIGLKLLTRVLLFPIPVCFYFYFQWLASSDSRYQKRDLLHLLPTVIAIIIVGIPYFHIGISSTVLTNTNSLAFARTGFHFMFFQSMVVLLYAKLSLYSIFDLKLEVFEDYANLLEKEKSWLLKAILGMFVIGFLGLLSSALGLKEMLNPSMNFDTITNYIYIVFGAVSLSFYWISYKAIQQPELFRTYEAAVEKKEKYSHSGMTAESAYHLATQLTNLMASERLYLQPALKLNDVAISLNVSPKVLSQLINQHFQQNFYDFVNGYRIEAAKAKLINPNFAQLSIQGIALESGFKSKSTFYSLFKKQTGLTPSQFQRGGDW